MAGRWPEAFESLLSELRSDRSRLALVDASDPGAPRLLDRLRSVVDDVVSVGGRLVDREQPPSASELVSGLGSAAVLLIDIDVLFAPELRVEPLSQLRRTAQNTALIVAWPGRIAGGRLSYSLPGRADHVDEPARDLVVLRPVEADFPDEVPYTVERYPA